MLQGTGLVATGTVADGEVCEGDEIWLMPSKLKLKARSLRVNSDKKLGSIRRPMRHQSYRRKHQTH